MKLVNFPQNTCTIPRYTCALQRNRRKTPAGYKTSSDCAVGNQIINILIFFFLNGSSKCDTVVNKRQQRLQFAPKPSRKLNSDKLCRAPQHLHTQTLCTTTIQNSFSVFFLSASSTHCMINAVHSRVHAACVKTFFSHPA